MIQISENTSVRWLRTQQRLTSPPQLQMLVKKTGERTRRGGDEREENEELGDRGKDRRT